MPFKSEAQRRFMYARHPEMAKRWEVDHAVSSKTASPEKVALFRDPVPVRPVGEAYTPEELEKKRKHYDRRRKFLLSRPLPKGSDRERRKEYYARQGFNVRSKEAAFFNFGVPKLDPSRLTPKGRSLLQQYAGPPPWDEADAMEAVMAWEDANQKEWGSEQEREYAIKTATVSKAASFIMRQRIKTAEEQQKRLGPRSHEPIPAQVGKAFRDAAFIAGSGMTGYVGAGAAHKGLHNVGALDWWKDVPPVQQKKTLQILSGVAGMGAAAAYLGTRAMHARAVHDEWVRSQQAGTE